MVFRQMLIESLNPENRIETDGNLPAMLEKHARFILVDRFQWINQKMSPSRSFHGEHHILGNDILEKAMFVREFPRP